MKLKFLYTNGKPFTATHVNHYYITDDEVIYDRFNKSTNMTESYGIPLESVVAVKSKQYCKEMLEIIKPKAYARLTKALA